MYESRYYGKRKKMFDETTPRYIGVELEVETMRDSPDYDIFDYDSYEDYEELKSKYDDEDIDYAGHVLRNKYRELYDLNKFEDFDCVYDCSLNGGFEIVSPPMTLRSHRESKLWKEIFDDIKSDRLDEIIEDTNTAGLHFTIDLRNKRDAIRLRRYLRTIAYNEFKTYCRRQYFRYCDFNSRFDDSKGTAVHIRSNVSTQDRCVVEIRVFKSTGDYDTFMSYLTFIDNLVAFILSLPNEDLETIPWPNFKDLLDDYGKKLMGYND